MPKSCVRSQHPLTHWNLTGADKTALKVVLYVKQNPKNPPVKKEIWNIPVMLTTDQRVHRLEMATFLRTFSHDGISDPAC
jgi:hypothetical protein